MHAHTLLHSYYFDPLLKPPSLLGRMYLHSGWLGRTLAIPLFPGNPTIMLRWLPRRKNWFTWSRTAAAGPAAHGTGRVLVLRPCRHARSSQKAKQACMRRSQGTGIRSFASCAPGRRAWSARGPVGVRKTAARGLPVLPPIGGGWRGWGGRRFSGPWPWRSGPPASSGRRQSPRCPPPVCPAPSGPPRASS